MIDNWIRSEVILSEKRSSPFNDNNNDAAAPFYAIIDDIYIYIYYL